MDLIPYYPFRDMEKWFDEWPSRWHDMFHFDFPTIREPKMDVYETKNKLVAEIEMPGIDEKTIDVSVENNILKIEAKKEEKVEEKKRGYYFKEIKSGYLRRAIALPAEVRGEKATAVYENGVLKVEIPKAKTVESKKKGIKVKIKK